MTTLAGTGRPAADGQAARARQEPSAGAVAAVAAALALPITTAQVQALVDYTGLLARWNGTYNLTAAGAQHDIHTHHVADCLALIPTLAQLQTAHHSRHAHTAPPWRVLDVGSGAGLPGAVIAIMLPSARVTCIDTVGKKAAFIRQAAGALALPNLHAVQGRVERWPVPSGLAALRVAAAAPAAQAAPAFDCIVSRAFASLADFTRLSAEVLAPRGTWIAMKGKLPQSEIDALPANVVMFHVEQLQVPGLDANRCLVWLRKADSSAVSAAHPISSAGRNA